MDSSTLPSSSSSSLHLDHPTKEELTAIFTNSSSSWKDSLTTSLYIQESHFLTTIPLARNGGVTPWILVDKTLPQNHRPILCFCESFRKRSLSSDGDGNVHDTIIHGIASVFCPEKYRARGYASRMMRELATILRTWQVEEKGHMKCIGSILYSDLGKSYYAKLGWKPTPTNTHMIFKPSKISVKLPSHQVRLLAEEDLGELCERDEVMIRKAMIVPTGNRERQSTVIPDLDHMLWHIRKEDFACNIHFGKTPQAKGAIVGPPGNQIWAIWVHRYYSHPNSNGGDNTLYILRLVTEKRELGADKDLVLYNEQVAYLKAVLQAARKEAVEWKLDQVNLWHPSPVIQDMIRRVGIEYDLVERKELAIASALWYGENGEECLTPPKWINNEHYAWC